MSKQAIYKLKYKYHKHKCNEMKKLLIPIADLNSRYQEILENIINYMAQIDMKALNEKNIRVNNEITDSEEPNAYDSEYTDSD